MQGTNNYFGNYTKTSLLKYVAMVIALCYLINPLNRQISVVIHEISHALEMPSTVIGHVPATEMISSHHSHNHEHHTNTHEHVLVKIFDAVFDASEGNSDSQDHILLDFKFDKHLTASNNIEIGNYYFPIFNNYKMLISKRKIGYCLDIDQPPRTSLFPNFT